MAMATEVAWRQDALEFEEAMAKELRQDLQSEAEANKAALSEYSMLRSQRDASMLPNFKDHEKHIDDIDESSMQLLDEAEILQNQLEIALGADLWRRMRREAWLDHDQSLTSQRSSTGSANAQVRRTVGLKRLHI
eukprot:g1407.t1